MEIKFKDRHAVMLNGRFPIYAPNTETMTARTCSITYFQQARKMIAAKDVPYIEK